MKYFQRFQTGIYNFYFHENCISQSFTKVKLHVSSCPPFFAFSPPPLCGAVPADSNYVSQPEDKVAARVRGQDGEENWILAEVATFNSSTGKYEVDDVDAEEGKE